MRETIDPRVPRYYNLFMPTFTALKALGGSGSNEEILNQVIADMQLPDEVADIPHGDKNISEVAYQLAWARTYLSKYGVIENSARAVWAISPQFVGVKELNVQKILKAARTASNGEKAQKLQSAQEVDDGCNSNEDDTDVPDEARPWRMKLLDILTRMNAFGFERLTQRVLRECGFTQVEVTKKTGDGGIDGYGKWKINGIFSFNVAFQCKRYSGVVGAGDIRDFRGSLTTDIEKGVFITTGTFSKAAKEEAAKPGKQQIDLIDGEAFMDKIAEYGIGVKEVKIYEVDEKFFEKI